MISRDIIRAVMLGGAVADAVGVPAEFKSRRYLAENPITDMVGYGTHKKPRGTFSDDTSMSLATLDSLCERGVDYDDAMQRFGAWWYKGEYTADGDTYDIGVTTSTAIDNYFFYKKPALECGLNDESSNGNGSLMRIHPAVLYCIAKGLSDFESAGIIESYSRLTHAHERSLVGCVIYYFILKELIKKPEKASIMRGIEASFDFVKDSPEMIYYMRLFSSEIASAREEDIKSSGYVVDTLEAAVWVTLNTESFREAVLRAVNLGEDTDTVAAVAGTLVAVLYGASGIPEDWLGALIGRDYIEGLCDKAYDKWSDG
jgi:ADP-ribosylglycohydrolase